MKNVFKSILFVLILVLSAAFVAANPVINPVADRTVNEGSLLTVQVTSTPPDGTSPLITRLCQLTPINNCPATASEIAIGATKANFTNLSTTSAEFKWQPDFTQAGVYTFNLSVSDADSATNATMKVTVVDVPPKLTVPETLALGGDTQERSNPRHDTTDKREINVSQQITLKNDGPEQLTGLKGTVSVAVASGFTESDLKVNFTLPKTTLAPGESVSFPISVRVPQKLDAVTRALSAAAVNVASITFSATHAAGSVSGTTQLNLKAENNLEINDLKVRFNGQSETVDNDDTVNDMKPGQTVELEIELENRFKEKEDVTIEDIEVKVVSNGELDIDEDEDVGDLGPEDKETIKLSFVIDDEADDGTFDVEITAEGVDEFGARHGEKWIIKFDIERKSHEIEIKSITLNPATVSCEKETRLSVDIRNSGRRDEDEVFVRVASPELSFGAVSDKLDVNENDEETVNFNIPVPESTPRSANYRITVDTYYNTGSKSNSDVALLSVQKCAPVTEEEVEPPVSKEPVTVVTVQPEQPKVNVTPTTTTAQPVAKKSFLETPQYVALLVLAYVVVLGGGAALLLKLVRKP